MSVVITMYGKNIEVDAIGTVSDALRSLNIRPNTFLFLVDGTPIPSDTPLKDGMTIQTIKVASGG